ncbi:gamma-glutamyltransferase family protein [Paenibacillus periandrae]|uniref:gamma-glutamyltransferase family protein n=1 Tax=Paenibacillus periandrae TaxID=1761741 RepID=UPI001F099179|nr:gamma-glutamyltransferase family protein [Paenibacillus periandrae]
MNFDPLYYPHASKRNIIYANKGMVAASQPIAAQVGLDMLKKGGNAIDAAIAVAACLTVVEPTNNGFGGDAFVLVWHQGELHGLNASGPSPQSISVEKLRESGYDKMPSHGWLPVTVPGIPAAWSALSEKFGKLPFAELFEPAIRYAEEGYAVNPTLGSDWAKLFARYRGEFIGEMYKPLFDTFAPGGSVPGIGELWRSPDHARTLQLIAETKAASFYTGELADQIDQYSRLHGGYLRKEDLAAFSTEWVKPVSINYRGYDIWEMPPNSQGIIPLMALNILKNYDLTKMSPVDLYHTQLEALKLAFADGVNYITQENHMSVTVEQLLSEDYALHRMKLIGPTAMQPEKGDPVLGDTVYLATADGEGNMVSYIQSNSAAFGSGIVIPGTGIGMQNRGSRFTLNDNDPNRLEPGKKCYHTIIPGFITKDNQPVGPFGVMGGFMQPHGHVQVVCNTIDFGLNPQSALDAPRWQWKQDKTIELEYTVPEHLALALSNRGHDVRRAVGTFTLGRGQIIWKMANGVLVGGTEPRTDSSIASW